MPTSDLSLRIYATAPLFVIAAGLLMARDGSLVLISRWMPGALAALHLIALGCLAQVVCGIAAQGRLPDGRSGRQRRLRSMVAHALLTLGTAGLGWALAGGPPALLVPCGGAVALGLSICAASLATRASLPGPPIWPTVALVVTALLGVGLTVVLAGWASVPQWMRWVEVHAAWGLLAWIGGLVMAGVAQPGPPEVGPRGRSNRWLHGLSALVIICVAGASLAWIIGLDPVVPVFLWALAAGLAGVALGALVRLARLRPRGWGPVIRHRGLVLASVCVAGAAWMLDGSPTLVVMLVVVGVGVGLSAAWILEGLGRSASALPSHPGASSGQVESPDASMGRLVSADLVQAQFVVQLITVVLLGMAFIAPDLLRLAGVCLTLSGLLLFVLVTRAARALGLASRAIAGTAATGDVRARV